MDHADCRSDDPDGSGGGELRARGRCCPVDPVPLDARRSPLEGRSVEATTNAASPRDSCVDVLETCIAADCMALFVNRHMYVHSLRTPVAKNHALGHVPSLSIQTLYNICNNTYGGNNKRKTTVPTTQGVDL
ncbi:hypothetical protein KC352_g36 [Hortaea werneckii]|nr:hypothetical protein KC352_g36 [Hortaea werneckii]